MRAARRHIDCPRRAGVDRLRPALHIGHFHCGSTLFGSARRPGRCCRATSLKKNVREFPDADPRASPTGLPESAAPGARCRCCAARRGTGLHTLAPLAAGAPLPRPVGTTSRARAVSRPNVAGPKGVLAPQALAPRWWKATTRAPGASSHGDRLHAPDARTTCRTNAFCCPAPARPGDRARPWCAPFCLRKTTAPASREGPVHPETRPHVQAAHRRVDPARSSARYRWAPRRHSPP
ncbi:hypothetical protein D3C78_511250 [compost metagenome]